MADIKVTEGWLIMCDWHEEDANRTHQSDLFVDPNEAAAAFRAEYGRPHPGRRITVRLLELERAGAMWGSPREIDEWTPADPLGPWTSEGRLRSSEQLHGRPEVVGKKPRWEKP